MTEHIHHDQLNHYLWQRQGFAGDTTSAPLNSLTGIYATPPMCYLSLLARQADFRFADLDEALYERRTVVRVRAMRYSVFLVTTALLPAIYQATRAQVWKTRAKVGKFAGLDDAQYARIGAEIEDLLDAESMPTGDIKKALSPEFQDYAAGLNYVVAALCAEGRLVRADVRGSWKSRIFAYARVDRWIPDVDLASISPKAAQIILAREYLDSYGPATAADFRWWSGLKKGEALAALAALEDETITIESDGVEYLMLAARLDELRACPAELPRGVAFLPAWDAYIMAYQGRGRYLADEHRDYIYDKVGNGTSAVLVNGVVGGVWSMHMDKKTLVIKVALFDEPDTATQYDLEGWLRRLVMVTGQRAGKLLRCETPPVLREGSQNLFQSPLKAVVGDEIFAVEVG